MPYLKANELDIEFYEINGEVFVPWADYLQLLLLYPRRTSKGGDQAELHAKQIRAVRLTLREYTGACPIEQHVCVASLFSHCAFAHGLGE